MRKFFTFLCLLTLVAVKANAQNEPYTESKWYVGVGGGVRFGSMTFSDLDKDVFPDKKGITSGLFSVFVERNFGKEGNFGIRPTLSILNRGGKLTGIYSTKAFNNYYENEGIDDVFYRLKAHYLDVRVPIFYQFGTYASRVRPYVYVAPTVGFPTGGKINVEQRYLSGNYNGYEMDLNKANIASAYFAGAIGIGAKWNLNVEGHNLYLALDASYELGLSNTYGKKEKNGEAIVQKGLFYNAYKINGNRKFSGFELMVTVGIPLGKKKRQPAYVAPVIRELEPAPVAAVVEEKEIVVEKKQEKPCYTLEEISDMMKTGENVYGKTFCAVDAIQFEFGKSNIKRSSHAFLDELANILTQTGIKVEVKGHTDNVGTEDFNMKLSKDRAEAVVNYLVKKGVPSSHLTYSYYGMSRPLAENETEDGRKLNRRVEFEILK
ncbi:MAG: OmpA family protein [Bacteroidaceae bacterium]